jgi:glutaredoxin 3
MADVRVYTSASCGWCGAVKRQLDKHGVSYREVRTDLDDGALQFLRQQMAFTVPQVFVGDHRVGGYEATSAAIASGAFDELLAA